MSTRPWLDQYDPGVPHTLQPYPRETLLDVLADSARQRPGHPAVHFKGRSLSYAELEWLSDSLATALARRGLSREDRVALIMPNCPQFLIAQLGVWKAGAIVVPLNPLYVDADLVHALQETGAKRAIVLTPFYEKVKALQGQTALQQVIATNIKEYLPWVAGLLFTLLRERKEGHRIRLQAGDLWLQDLLRQEAQSAPPDVSVAPADPALLMFTGGTTGRAKAALSTHHGLLMAGMQLHAWMEGVTEAWQDVTLLLMPLFHTYGNVGVLSTSLVARHTMVPVPNPRDLDDLVATIRRTKPAFLCGVPTLFNALLAHPAVKGGQVDLRSIKFCISGAAPLLAATRERFEALTGGRLVEGYALTESVMAAAITPLQAGGKDGAIGVPLPDVDVRIADPDSGEGSLPPCAVGEIAVRAPQLMREYWQQPEETTRAIRDGWLYTGDLGYLDEDGYLYLVDRKKDVIKPSGFQVWPREVEEVIATHPAVAEVAVAGVPDVRQGEAVKAWVVLEAGSALSADELRAFCRQHLTAYKVPRHVAFCGGLPKSAVGKVLRRELARTDVT